MARAAKKPSQKRAPNPAALSAHIMVLLHPDEKERLKALAAQASRTVSNYTRMLVLEHLRTEAPTAAEKRAAKRASV